MSAGELAEHGEGGLALPVQLIVVCERPVSVRAHGAAGRLTFADVGEPHGVVHDDVAAPHRQREGEQRAVPACQAVQVCDHVILVREDVEEVADEGPAARAGEVGAPRDTDECVGIP